MEITPAGLAVRGLFERNPSALPELLAMADRIEDLPELREEIPTLIDPKDGVRDEASEKLKELRAEIRSLRAELRKRSAGTIVRNSASV